MRPLQLLTGTERVGFLFGSPFSPRTSEPAQCLPLTLILSPKGRGKYAYGEGGIPLRLSPFSQSLRAGSMLAPHPDPLPKGERVYGSERVGFLFGSPFSPRTSEPAQCLPLTLTLSPKGRGYMARRGWDSNPRNGFPFIRSPGVLLRPLGHLSSKLFLIPPLQHLW